MLSMETKRRIGWWDIGSTKDTMMPFYIISSGRRIENALLILRYLGLAKRYTHSPPRLNSTRDGGVTEWVWFNPFDVKVMRC